MHPGPGHLRLVHHAPRAAVGRLLATAVALAAAASLAACGGGDDAGQPSVEQGGPTIGVPIQLASCEDWEGATVEERLGTIAQIENFAGGPVGTGDLRGPTLDRDRAYDLMESFCGEDFARGFRLYKLYTRAAAFAPVEGQG